MSKSTDPAALILEIKINQMAQEKANKIIKSEMFKQLNQIVDLLKKTNEVLDKITKKHLSFEQRLKRLETMAFPEDQKVGLV